MSYTIHHYLGHQPNNNLLVVMYAAGEDDEPHYSLDYLNALDEDELRQLITDSYLMESTATTKEGLVQYLHHGVFKGYFHHMQAIHQFHQIQAGHEHISQNGDIVKFIITKKGLMNNSDISYESLATSFLDANPKYK